MASRSRGRPTPTLVPPPAFQRSQATTAELMHDLRAVLGRINEQDKEWVRRWIRGAVLGLEPVARAKEGE